MFNTHLENRFVMANQRNQHDWLPFQNGLFPKHRPAGEKRFREALWHGAGGGLQVAHGHEAASRVPTAKNHLFSLGLSFSGPQTLGECDITDDVVFVILRVLMSEHCPNASFSITFSQKGC